MVFCAVNECRSEGGLLLHIRHGKKNLLQAEYCVDHFSAQALEWAEDIRLADRIRNRYEPYERNSINLERVRETIEEALYLVWDMKREGHDAQAIVVRFEEEQAEYRRRIEKAKETGMDIVV